MAVFQNTLSRRQFSRILTSSATLIALPESARAHDVAVSVKTTSTSGIIDVRGHFPKLAFEMKRVSDGKIVTASAYHGEVVIVYFGFTRCTDTCPLTTLNAARLFSMLDRKEKSKTRFLFVTIDLDYDTPKRLQKFLANFGPPPYIDGLYGTPSELNDFTKRYGVYFKAPMSADSPDPVSAIQHSGAVYLFGPHGSALAIINDLGGGHPHLQALAHKIRTLI